MASKVRLENEPLTVALVNKAEKELRETTEVKEKAIAELRELLKKETTIYFKDSDEILIRYLRPTKFYPQSALELMRRIADFKHKNKSILDNLMPASCESAFLEHDTVNVLVDRDQDGRRILVAHVGKKWDTSKVSNDVVFQMFYLIHQGALMEPATQVNGVVVILDFDGLGMKQVAALSPAFSLRLLSFIQDAMPLRLKQVHIVNQPFLFNMVWQIFKPLVKEKLKKRLFFHGTKTDELHKLIDPAYLPKNYGGKLPEINYSSKNWYPEIKALDTTIAENNSFGLKK